jgi:hypothetical protein
LSLDSNDLNSNSIGDKWNINACNKNLLFTSITHDIGMGENKKKKAIPKKKKHLSIPFKAYFKLKPILIDRV